MQRVFSLRIGWAIAIYALLDIVCTGMGMGVPIVCIFLGLPVGWYIAQRVTRGTQDTQMILQKMLSWAGLAATFTFVLMVLVWGSSVVMLSNSGTDLANYGEPLILYEPLASFIGWLVLMIVISPVLQFLMALFGCHITWWWRLTNALPSPYKGEKVVEAVTRTSYQGRK